MVPPPRLSAVPSDAERPRGARLRTIATATARSLRMRDELRRAVNLVTNDRDCREWRHEP